MKCCTKCSAMLEESDFYVRSSGVVSSVCKSCDNARRNRNAKKRRELLSGFVDAAVEMIPNWMPSLRPSHQRQARFLIDKAKEVANVDS